MSNDPKDKGAGKLHERAFGPAADAFGKEVAPLGKEAGVVVNKVGSMLIKGVAGTVYGIEQVAEWVKNAVADGFRYATSLQYKNSVQTKSNGCSEVQLFQ